MCVRTRTCVCVRVCVRKRHSHPPPPPISLPGLQLWLPCIKQYRRLHLKQTHTHTHPHTHTHRILSSCTLAFLLLIMRVHSRGNYCPHKEDQFAYSNFPCVKVHVLSSLLAGDSEHRFGILICLLGWFACISLT